MGIKNGALGAYSPSFATQIKSKSFYIPGSTCVWIIDLADRLCFLVTKLSREVLYEDFVIK